MELDFQTNLFVAIIIALSTISQAAFGVGILLWGTPALLLLNYGFLEALSLLLPISLFVSFFQFAPKIKELDFNFIGQFLKISIPGLTIGLLLVVFVQLQLNVVTSSMLLIAYFMRRNRASSLLRDLILKYDSLFMFFMGFAHGISNLGGPLLVARLSLKGYSKNHYRINVSAAYFVFAASQLIILFMLSEKLIVSVSYILISGFFYLITNTLLVSRINSKLFDSLISSLILIMVIFLLIRSLM
jgi:uncharacterized protein